MSISLTRARFLFDKFTRYTRPDLPCPKCGVGELIFRNNWANRMRDSNTQKEKPHFIILLPEKNTEHFSGFAICSKDTCKEPVALCGLIKYVYEYNEKQLKKEAV